MATLLGTYGGTVTSVTNKTLKYTFSVKVEYEQSISNNTTTLYFTPTVSKGSASSGYAIDMYFKVDGVDYFSAYHNFGTWGDSYTASTHTKTITHDNDGTKKITLNVSFETTYTQGANAGMNDNVPKWGTIVQDVTLPTIPRASSMSFSDFTMGTSGEIKISRHSSNFTHTVEYYFGGSSGTIATGVGESCKWTPSKELGKQIPNNLSGTGTLYLYTYNSGTHIGTYSQQFTLSVAGDMYPTFTSLSVSGVNLMSGLYVMGTSSAKLTINGATGSYGSTIKSYSITGHAISSTSSSATTSVLAQSGELTYTGKITDSRGRTATKTVKINVVTYSRPSITKLNCYRCSSSGTINGGGAYLAVQLTYSIDRFNGSNAKTWKVQYRIKNSKDAYTTHSGTFSSYTGTSVTLFAGNGYPISTANSYEIIVTINDSYQSTTQNTVVLAGACLLNIEEAGLGVGKYHEIGILDIAGDIYLDGNKMFETGTFNPSFYVSSGCSMVFLRRVGEYQVINKWCVCKISLKVENFTPGGTPSNSFTINNLPFGNMGTYASVAIGYIQGVKTDPERTFFAYIQPNGGTQIVFVAVKNDGSAGYVTGNSVASTLEVSVTAVYRIRD